MTDAIRSELLVLEPDGDISGALQTEGSFVVRAPLGRRGEIRTLIRGLAGEQGKRVLVGMPWYGVIEPEEPLTYADYFYVLVTA